MKEEKENNAHKLREFQNDFKILVEKYGITNGAIIGEMNSQDVSTSELRSVPFAFLFKPSGEP